MATSQSPENPSTEGTVDEMDKSSEELTADDVFTAQAPEEPEAETEEESAFLPNEDNSTSSGFGERNVSMLMDVELNVSVELGRKKMSISEILKLGKGAVIELAKAAGEPLDIYVNGTRMARGEVVVIDEQFAVRITELASPKERIKGLG